MNTPPRADALNLLLPDLLRRLSHPLTLADPLPPQIRLDLTENDRDYEVRAELPGARKEDISITIDGSFVSIAAQVHGDHEETDAGGRVLFKETMRGRVSRGFSLAHEVDAGRVVARLQDGVLRLTLPKRESSRSRTIAVQ